MTVSKDIKKLTEENKHLKCLLSSCHDYITAYLDMMCDYEGAEEDSEMANELLESIDEALAK